MLLLKIQTQTKIAAIKAIREASRTVHGGTYTLSFAKAFVENGCYVPDHMTFPIMSLISATLRIIAEMAYNCNEKPSFTFTVENCDTMPVPVNFDNPQFT